jgi:hypothetical protein
MGKSWFFPAVFAAFLLTCVKSPVITGSAPSAEDF